MRSLIFFLVIMGVDIFLKSIKDKKKIEESRQKKIQELRNKEEVKPVKEPEKHFKREVVKNPTIAKKNNENGFFGEGKSYRDDHEGYRDRYEERYENMSKEYQTIEDSHHSIKPGEKSKTLYDKNAIETRKKEDEDLDVRNYGKTKEKIEIPVPTASTFKSDVLNGIIFAEILGKPKSMQKRDL